MWAFWIPILYILVSIPFGIHTARQELAADLKNHSKGWYLGDGSPRLTEEQRIHLLASKTFWPGIGAGLMWPLTCVLVVIGWVWDAGTYTIAGRELREARKRDEDKKTKAILDQIKKDELEQFKELED